MPRWFNTAGPCDPVDHYMLPALRRLPQVRSLIDETPMELGMIGSRLALLRFGACLVLPPLAGLFTRAALALLRG